jgi:hypothetical protein
VELGFNLQMYETGRCTSPDGTDLLIVEMARNRLGVWRVEVHEIGGRTIDTSYPTEANARRAVELAYAYGRQTGRWHIQRRHDYVPDTSAGTVSPVGIEGNMPADEPPAREHLDPTPSTQRSGRTTHRADQP